MIEQETLGALKLLDSRLGQLVEAARLHDRRLLALRELVGKLQIVCALHSDLIAGVLQTLDELSNKNATLEDALTANKEPAYGL